MSKIYFASGISDAPRKKYQSEVAKKIEALGHEVYAAANNNSINDKSNDPTPMDIYVGDIHQIQSADIVVACISGGNEDGTISEIGMTAGWNAAVTEIKEKYGNDIGLETKPIIMYSTNERLTKPQFWQGTTIKNRLKRGEKVSDEHYKKIYDRLAAEIIKLPEEDANAARKMLDSIDVAARNFSPYERTKIMLIESAMAQDGFASAGFNHLVAGMIDRWGTFAGNEEGMLELLKGE